MIWCFVRSLITNVQDDKTKKGNAKENKRVFCEDLTNMNAIKSYIYEHMVPEFSYREF